MNRWVKKGVPRFSRNTLFHASSLSLSALRIDGSLIVVARRSGVEIPHARGGVGLNPLHGFDVTVAEEEIRHATVNAHIGAAPPA